MLPYIIERLSQQVSNKHHVHAYTANVWQCACIYSKCVTMCMHIQQMCDNVHAYTANVWQCACIYSKCVTIISQIIMACDLTASSHIYHTRKCSCSIGWASEILGKCWHFQLHWGRLIWICIGFLPASCQIWIHISLLVVEYVMTCKGGNDDW